MRLKYVYYPLMTDRLRPYMWDVVKPNPRRSFSYGIRSFLPRAAAVLVVSTPVAACGAVVFERFAVDIFKVIRGKRPSKFLRPQRDTGWIRDRLNRARRNKS